MATYRTDLRDPSTFAAAYEAHARGVYGAALAVLADPAQADDVVQDVFLRLWFRPQLFDAARGSLGPFLRTMARSRATDLWRKGRAQHRATARLTVLAPRDESRPEDQPGPSAEREEVRAELLAALEELPVEQREAVILAHFGDLTVQEIADGIGIPLGTAKSRIRLGLQKLRDGYGLALEGSRPRRQAERAARPGSGRGPRLRSHPKLASRRSAAPAAG
jgi:RNA polymerase sigma-70 factor, ECF subfamily